MTSGKFTGIYSHSSSRTVQKYVSRPELEERLRAQLIARKVEGKQQRTVVVWGLGGSGKSQLTLNYVQKHQEAYGPIFWIDARVKETIERDITHIHKLIYSDLDTSSATVEDAIAAVKNWFSTEERQKDKRRALWIMDSADAIDHEREAPSYIDIQRYLPDALNLDIIVTTRSSRARCMSSYDSVEVEKMSKTEAKLLFLRNANMLHKCEEADREASKIVEELGCLALAVALAGSYVSETKIEVQQYLPRYRADRTRMLALKPRKLEHQYTEGVLSTWELSFAALQRQSPVAAQLLILLAFLNPNDIFLGLFEDELNAPNDPDDLDEPRWLDLLSPDGTHTNITIIESAFTAIEAYSLISWQVDQSAYTMHNMVHAWGHDRLEVPRRCEWSFATLELLNRVTDRNIYNPGIATRMVPHLVATFTAVKNANGLNFQMTDRDILLLQGTRQNLSAMGRYTHAHDVDVYRFQATELVYGRKHPKTLTAMYDLSLSLLDRDDNAQAETLLRETSKLQAEMLGSRHRVTLSTLAALGTSLHNQGKHKVAEELLRSASELQQKELGFDDHDTLYTIHVLSGTLSAQGKYRQTEEMQRRVLGSRKKLLGSEHPDTLDSMYRLADTLDSLGEFEEAEQMCRQVSDLQHKTLGPRHPHTLRSRSLLARLLGRNGEYQQAKAIFQETIALQQQVWGPDHGNVLRTLYYFARVLVLQGEYEEAEQICQELVESTTRTLGSEHPGTQISLRNLARVQKMNRNRLKGGSLDVPPHQEPVGTQDASRKTQWPSLSRTTRNSEVRNISTEKLKAEPPGTDTSHLKLSNAQSSRRRGNRQRSPRRTEGKSERQKLTREVQKEELLGVDTSRPKLSDMQSSRRRGNRQRSHHQAQGKSERQRLTGEGQKEKLPEVDTSRLKPSDTHNSTSRKNQQISSGRRAGTWERILSLGLKR
ncbi:hypothetical protein ES702_01133 [subsurface metagenome]